MNPKIAELYKWSVRPKDGVWVARGPRPDDYHWEETHAGAMNYATDQARKNAGQRVLMALMLAAVQGTATLG